MIRIYTDGSYSKETGVGGWSAVVVDTRNPSKNFSVAGVLVRGNGFGLNSTTLEMTAIIEGLRFAPHLESIEVYTDQRNFLDVLSGGGKVRQKYKWWKELCKVRNGKRIAWRYIRAHAGNPMHNKADKLARKMWKEHNEHTRYK